MSSKGPLRGSKENFIYIYFFLSEGFQEKRETRENVGKGENKEEPLMCCVCVCVPELI